MGWFSADEIVQNSSSDNGHDTAQTIAICALAAVAVAYGLFKLIGRVHRQQTERVAERAVRMATLPA